MRAPVVTPADAVARRHYETVQVLAMRTEVLAVEAWSRVDLANIAASWAMQIPHLANAVAAGQRLAAGRADGYVTDALAAADNETDPAGRVNPAAFAGVASDGRPLKSLLTQPAITSLRALSTGAELGTALEQGVNALRRIVATQVSDAGRVADGVAVFNREGVGYVRMLVPPACSRCAVLAGRRYRSNQGFQRHPRCDCRHVPVPEAIAGDITVDTSRYFDSLSKGEQDRIFTEDGAQAIRDGADIGQVVNARRGMTAAGTTTEGTTRRGFAGKRLEQSGAAVERRKIGTRTVQTSRGVETGQIFETRVRTRLMPERIYQLADGDRDVALKLLRENGFVV